MALPTHAAKLEKLSQAIAALGGADCASVLASINRARARFEAIGSEVNDLIEAKGPVQVRFDSNHNFYTDSEPAETAIVVYYDVSSCSELAAGIARTRAVLAKELGSSHGSNVRFSDLKQQHVTAFVEMLGEWSSATAVEGLLRVTATKYSEAIRQCHPFTVSFAGPHLTQAGGVILEGIVYSDQVFKLREMAASNLEGVPRGAERRIYQIVHTSVGYLLEATRPQLRSLSTQLDAIRKQWSTCSARVRDARIAVVRNKTLVGEVVRIPFRGRQPGLLSNEEIQAALIKILKLRSIWGDDRDLRNIVREEALFWSEAASSNLAVQGLAAEIVAFCM